MTGSTTACLLTAPGRGAIATIAVSGPAAEELVDRRFQSVSQRRVRDADENRVLLGTWGATGEELVVCRVASQRIEIHCHGGLAAAAAILADITQGGARRVDSADWCRQRFSAIEAEARVALTRAATPRVTGVLLQQLRGALGDAIEQIIRSLDDRQIEAATARIERLLDTAKWGLRLNEPWRVAICGPPNVGKSSLLNQLVGFERVIVFDQPGTTRDAVLASTAIDGWPFDFVDTAGLRETRDAIEAEGVRRATEAMQRADLILWIDSFDQIQPPPASAGPCLWVRNKRDLPLADVESSAGTPPLTTSATRGDGLEELAAALVDHFAPAPFQPDGPVVFTLRQHDELQAALTSLTSGELQPARAAVEKLAAPAPS